MATQTQVLRKPTVNATRTYDFLYDPVHTISSNADHAKNLRAAQTKFDRIKKAPIYPQMFSELRHYPRATVYLDPVDPLPKFVNRNWPGYQAQAREALIRYKTFNNDQSITIPPAIPIPSTDVTGKDRAKFFRRPIIPFMQQVPPEVLLQSTTVDPLVQPGGRVERPPTPATRTIAIQTMYRDGETQTAPYTSAYVVRPGSAPELLTLATLSHGHGLPAGLAEVEMIERARAKRAWEAELPPLNDVDQLDKRRKMMDEMERTEWRLREQEIEKLQEVRLELLKQMLKEREENHDALTSKRLDRLWAKKQKEREVKVKKIRSEYLKDLRKLEKKRKNVEGKYERRDIINDYVDAGSQVYAPLMRFGVFLDRGSEQYNIKSHFLSTYDGIKDLEDFLPDFMKNPKVKVPVQPKLGEGGFLRREERHQLQLATLCDQMKKKKRKKEKQPLAFLQKVEKPIPRPPTPVVDQPEHDEEGNELAVILLQRLVRGRATQNAMFEGKEKRLELIRELRSTHALQEQGQSFCAQQMDATLSLQRQRTRHEHKENVIDQHLSEVQGENIGDMFDFLSKELIRLQEERRIHAFSMLAERDRRVREAEESGRRQVEERRRREEDEIFKQMMKINQNSVDSYLEDVILEAVDETSKEQARGEIQEVSKKINDIAYELEETRTELESEEIVADLVYGFLLPEVMQKSTQEKVHQAQRKHLNAAHKIIKNETEEVIGQVSREISRVKTISHEIQTASSLKSTQKENDSTTSSKEDDKTTDVSSSAYVDSSETDPTQTEPSSEPNPSYSIGERDPKLNANINAKNLPDIHMVSETTDEFTTMADETSTFNQITNENVEEFKTKTVTEEYSLEENQEDQNHSEDVAGL